MPSHLYTQTFHVSLSWIVFLSLFPRMLTHSSIHPSHSHPIAFFNKVKKETGRDAIKFLEKREWNGLGVQFLSIPSCQVRSGLDLISHSRTLSRNCRVWIPRLRVRAISRYVYRVYHQISISYQRVVRKIPADHVEKVTSDSESNKF